MKTFVIQTTEIDDAQAAVADILSQLEAAGPLQTNTVGLVACHYEFVLSGTLEEVCKELPFPVAGTITSGQSTAQGTAVIQLSIMVLTDDAVVFRTARSASLQGDSTQAVQQCYRDASEGMEGAPALMFAFAPFIPGNTGDHYVEVLAEESKGAPCFGTLAVDDTPDFHECYMLFNGEASRDCMALVLAYGPLNPRFYLATISPEKVLDKAAVITSAEGPILKEVNGRPLVEYFEDLGLTKASETRYAMISLPFMLDYQDGTPRVSKVFVGFDEDKNGICASVMPEDSLLYMGVFDRDDVLLTTGQAMDDAIAHAAGASGMLMYSCVSRFMSLGSDQFAEMDLVRKKIGSNLPFLMAYSGGELSPTGTTCDGAVNRFHDNTFIVCVF